MEYARWTKCVWKEKEKKTIATKMFLVVNWEWTLNTFITTATGLFPAILFRWEIDQVMEGVLWMEP